MKYYLHDTNSFNDEKITELFLHHGYEGLGLFYTILERIAMQEKPIKTSVLKAQLKVGKKLEKCWSFMESIGLIYSNNGETFNEQLLNFSEKYQVKKEKNKERVAQWRENQSDKKSVTHYEHVRNTPKVNISKVKESKVNIGTNVPVETIVPTVQEIIDLRAQYNKVDKTLEAIKKFIRDCRPPFPEPYRDLWNLFAAKYSFPTITGITDERKRKLTTRLSEEEFDFVKILHEAATSTTLKESAWFTFDWFTKSQANYIKVLEGNYRDKALPGKETPNTELSQATREMLNNK